MKNQPHSLTLILSLVVAIFCLLMITAFTILSIIIIVVDKEFLDKPDTQKKYGSLYLNLDYKHRASRVYNLVFIFRRIFLAIYAT